MMLVLTVTLASMTMWPPCRLVRRERPAVISSKNGDLADRAIGIGNDMYESRSLGDCASAGRTAKQLAYGEVYYRHRFYQSLDYDMVLVAERFRDGDYVDAAKMLSEDSSVAQVDRWSLSLAALAKATRGEFRDAELILSPDAIEYLRSPAKYFAADGDEYYQTITLTPLTLALITCARGKNEETEGLLYALIAEYTGFIAPDLGPSNSPPDAFSAAVYLIGELTHAGSRPFTCTPRKR